MRPISCTLALAAAITVIVIQPDSHAATVEWGDVFVVDEAADISNPLGSIVHFAADFNNEIGAALRDDSMINGIPITSIEAGNVIAGQLTTAMDSGPNHDGTWAPPTDDLDLDTLLDSHSWQGGNPGVASFTIEGLSVGAMYQIQLIAVADDRACCSARTYEPDDGAGNFTTGKQLSRGDHDSIIGTFVADAETQTIQFRSLDDATGNNDPGLSGMIVLQASQEDDDEDGLFDPWEIANGLDPFDNDSDDDGILDGDEDEDLDDSSNLEEQNARTEPDNPDTDDDGYLDGHETNTGAWVGAMDTGSDPRNPDSDGDGLPDGVENPDLPFVDEAQTGSDPNKVESDGDGLLDGFEIQVGLSPASEDTDNNGTPDPEEDSDSDGLDNIGEQTAGSDPSDTDSDDDNLTDGEEVNTHGSDPTLTDSDGDTLGDGDEVNGNNVHGFTSDPTLADTDADGAVDQLEISVGTDPRDPADFPAVAPDLAWSADGSADGLLATWTPTINSTGNDGITFTEGTAGTVQSGASNFANVNAWVNSPGYNLNANPNDSWQDGLGNPATQENVSWELVFRPGDFADTHTLFNTGGNGDGTAFTLVGSILDFRFQDANSDAQRVVVSTDLALIGAATDFFHVVGVCDVNTAASGTGSLYVNGVLVDGPTTSTGSILDWDGGDLAELGKGNNIPGANPFNPAPFTGDIAAFNYYGGDLLNEDTVAALYSDISGGGALFQITEIIYDQAADEFTLTWTATEGAVYGLFYSLDMNDWGSDVNDSIIAEGDSVTFGPFPNPASDAGGPPARIYFRAERQ